MGALCCLCSFYSSVCCLFSHSTSSYEMSKIQHFFIVTCCFLFFGSTTDVTVSICRDSIQKLGDVMKKFAPFLKLYTEYVKNFDRAMNVITQWQDKSTKFAELLTSLQVCTLSTLQLRLESLSTPLRHLCKTCSFV